MWDLDGILVDLMDSMYSLMLHLQSQNHMHILWLPVLISPSICDICSGEVGSRAGDWLVDSVPFSLCLSFTSS